MKVDSWTVDCTSLINTTLFSNPNSGYRRFIKHDRKSRKFDARFGAEPWFSSFPSNCILRSRAKAAATTTVSKDLRSLWSSQARGLLYKAKAKASGLYDICAQICHNFSHLKICIESSAVKDLWGISRFKFCRIFPIFMQIVGSFSRPMQWNGAWVEWMNIWGNWRQREGTGGVENVITKHGVGRSEDEMADKTSQRKHKYISLKTNICLIDTNISWTIQIFVGVQENVMTKQEVGRWKDEMGDKSSSMERQLSSWRFNATSQFLPDEILTLLPVSLGSRTIFWVKISFDIFHEPAGRERLGGLNIN